MSKQVDLSKPLSDTDREYLLSRDRHEEVAFNAVATGTKLPDDVRESIAARGINMDDVKQRVRLARGETPTESASAAPEDSGAVEGQSDEGSGDSGGTDGQDAGPAKYSDEWFEKATIAQLQPELEKYGLSKTGKRDELADRLYEKLIDEGVISDEDE